MAKLGYSPGDIVDLLGAFPAEESRDFERATVDLLKALDTQTTMELDSLIRDANLPAGTRYAAFFTLGTFLRRSGRFVSLLTLVDEFQSEFGSHGTFHHLKAMAYTGRGESHDLELALASVKKAREILPDHHGVAHSYVVVLVSQLEQLIPLSETVTRSEHKSVLKEADDLLSEVLNRDPHYGKFHETLARIQSLGGHHQDAQRSISKAIEWEDPLAADFGVRMVSYNKTLSRIVMREALCRVAEQTEQAVTASDQAQESVKGFVESMQTRYLEMLGVFSAIVGIVLAGIQVATSMNFGTGAALMLIVTGAIVAMFAVIGAVVQRPVRFIGSLAGVSAVLIGAGLIAGLLAG